MTATPGSALGRIDELALRVAAGADLPHPRRLPPRCRRAVAVAVAVGAPLADAVAAVRGAEEDVAAAERAVAVASAQGRTVGVVLVAAPWLVAPVLTTIVDVDLLGFYMTGLGALVLAVALVLYGAGAGVVLVLLRRAGSARSVPPQASFACRSAPVLAGAVAWWAIGALAAPLTAVATHLVMSRRRAGPPVEGVDEAVDLVATALQGAVATSEALRIVADRVPGLATDLRRLAWRVDTAVPGTASVDGGVTAAGGGEGATRTPSELQRLTAVLHTAAGTGAALAPTLRRLAAQLRADSLAARLAAAERLPAQLTFPTALLLLPATVLLIGAPIVYAGWAHAAW